MWLKKFEADTAPELRPSCLSLLRKVELQRAWRVGCGRGAVRRPLLVWIGLYSMQKLLASKKEVLPIIMITAPLSSQMYPVTVSITHQHSQRHITTSMIITMTTRGTILFITIITWYSQHH